MIELIIVSSIITLVSSIFVEHLICQSDFLWTSTTQAEMRSQAQLALDAVLGELRHTTRAAAGSPPNLVIPAPPNNTTMTFYLPIDIDGNGLIVDNVGNIEWDIGNPVQYQFVPAARQLRRVVGVNSRVLANDVNGVTFEDRNIDGAMATDEVRIRLVFQRVSPRQRVVSETATAIVKMRN